MVGEQADRLIRVAPAGKAVLHQIGERGEQCRIRREAAAGAPVDRVEMGVDRDQAGRGLKVDRPR
jgi:hypothetical protein